MMTEKEWRQLFDLMQKVNDLPDKSTFEKGLAVVGAAVRLDADVTLEEFQSMVDLAWTESR